VLTFERIDTGSVDWENNIRLFPGRNVFQTQPWLSFVANTQRAEPVVAVIREAGKVCGYFTGLITNKFGFRILGSPFPGWSTSYMGMCLGPGTARRRAVEGLVQFAFRDLRCIHLELLDRRITVDDLKGLAFAYRMVRGFEVDLRPMEEEIFARMSKTCRWSIRKAERNGVTVEEARDSEFADDYYAQLKDVFAKQSLTPTYSLERVRELIRTVYPSGMLLLLRARDPEGRCIATGIFPAANETMYFWGGASWREHQRLLPNEAIQWYAIRYWKRRGIHAYDMNGSGDYKRKYGGTEIFVPWFRKSKYSSISTLRGLAHKFIKTRQIVSGRWQHGF
jgi:hypothetical protein